jgi:regulatory protein
MAAPQISLKARALRYLSAREHSRLELARKLARHAQAGDDIEALLDALEAANLLSQTRFAESLLNRRAAHFGNSRILSELQSHGIKGEVLDDIRAELGQDEIERVREVWRKKFGKKPEDANARAKQTRFLLQRGFSSHAIQAVLRSPMAEDEE